jgi:hypothetical protein
MPLAKELMGVGIPAGAAIAIINGVPTSLAATGSVQGDAALVGAGTVQVTAADGTKGVILPAANPGESVKIVNNAGSTLKVYPPSGAAIGVPGTSFSAATANASYAHTTFAVVEYVCYSSTLWMVNKSA